MFYNSLLGVSGLFTTIDPDNTGYVLQFVKCNLGVFYKHIDILCVAHDVIEKVEGTKGRNQNQRPKRKKIDQMSYLCPVSNNLQSTKRLLY
jgi:hypothetical protein